MAVMAEGFCKLMEVDVYGFTNTNATDRATGWPSICAAIEPRDEGPRDTGAQ